MTSWVPSELPPVPGVSAKKKSKGPWYHRYRLIPKKWNLFVGIRIIVLFVFLGGIAGAGAAYFYLNDLGFLEEDPDRFSSLLTWKPADNTEVYDVEGKKIAELFSSYHIYVPYQELPEILIQAIIATEDQNFFTHIGVDPVAMIRAFLVWISSGTLKYKQGASTITQQLVRHFFLPKEKTLNRKIREIILAIELEKVMSKEKILEIYVNSMFMGHGAYGVGAAAKRFFNRKLDSLALHEFALVAGLFQSPSRFNPHKSPKKAKFRQNQVLNAMVSASYLTVLEAGYWRKKKLRYRSYQSSWGEVAPYFIDYVSEEARSKLNLSSLKNKGLRIYTTLNQSVQKKAELTISESTELFAKTEELTKKWRRGLSESFALESAILITNHRNGDIEAMVGGRDYNASRFNRCVQALRQPGSAFKPVVYSLGLLKGMKWSDTIYVSPVTLAGHYRPKSPSGDYMTQTTLLRAFYRSMNAPTMELGQKLGVDEVIDHAKKLGIQSPVKKEYGSLLGSSEVTMLDLSRLYGVFASQGVLREPEGINKITDKHGKIMYLRESPEKRGELVLDPRIAFMMTHGMKQVLYRGTGWKYGEFGRYAAGKTGTSNEAKDNWFSGYTTDKVAIVWVGTDQPESLYSGVQGSTLALPVWATLMGHLYGNHKPSNFDIPEGVTSVNVNTMTGMVDPQGVRMWFLKHQAPVKKQDAPGSLSNLESFRNPF